MGEVQDVDGARREYDRLRHALPLNRAKDAARCRRRRDLLQLFKLERGCVDCGYAAHAGSLQFDHVRGEKLFEVNNSSVNRSDVSITAEIAKCDLVCANCHQVRTDQRRVA